MQNKPDDLSTLVELGSGIPGLVIALIESSKLWGIEATIDRVRSASKSNMWYAPYKYLISSLDEKAHDLLEIVGQLGTGELPICFFFGLDHIAETKEEVIGVLERCFQSGLFEKPENGKIRLAPIVSGLIKIDAEIAQAFLNGRKAAINGLVRVLPETTRFRFFDSDFQSDILLLYPPAINLCRSVENEAAATLLQRVGVHHLMMGDKETYQKSFRQSFEWFQTHMGDHAPSTIKALKEYACTFQGQKEEYTYCRKLVDLAQQALDPNDPLLLSILHYKSIVLGDRGEIQEAESLARKVASAQESILGPRHLDTLRTKNSLSLFLYYNDQIDAAIDLLKSTLIDANQVMLPNDPDRLRILANLASYFSTQIKDSGFIEDTQHLVSEVRRMSEEVLRHQAANFGKLHANTTWAASNLHTYYVDFQCWNEAKALLETYLEWLFEPPDSYRPISPMHKSFKDKLIMGAKGFFKEYRSPEYYGFPLPRSHEDAFTRCMCFISQARIILGEESDEFSMVLGDGLKFAIKYKVNDFIEELRPNFPNWIHALEQIPSPSEDQRNALKHMKLPLKKEKKRPRIFKKFLGS